jgi:hypothetical protein
MSAENTTRDLRLNDSLTVRQGGEEIEVYNWVNIKRRSIVRGNNPVVEHGEATIHAGDSRIEVDAVTHWLGEELKFEFGIDVTEHGIEVIDPTSDEVDVL